jgi:hypothetical protein
MNIYFFLYVARGILIKGQLNFLGDFLLNNCLAILERYFLADVILLVLYLNSEIKSTLRTVDMEQGNLTLSLILCILTVSLIRSTLIFFAIISNYTLTKKFIRINNKFSSIISNKIKSIP